MRERETQSGPVPSIKIKLIKSDKIKQPELELKPYLREDSDRSSSNIFDLSLDLSLVTSTSIIMPFLVSVSSEIEFG